MPVVRPPYNGTGPPQTPPPPASVMSSQPPGTTGPLHGTTPRPQVRPHTLTTPHQDVLMPYMNGSLVITSC